MLQTCHESGLLLMTHQTGLRSQPSSLSSRGAVAADWNPFQGRKGAKTRASSLGAQCQSRVRARELMLDKIIRGLLFSCATRQRRLDVKSNLQSSSCPFAESNELGRAGWTRIGGARHLGETIVIR